MQPFSNHPFFNRVKNSSMRAVFRARALQDCAARVASYGLLDALHNHCAVILPNGIEKLHCWDTSAKTNDEVQHVEGVSALVLQRRQMFLKDFARTCG